MGLPQRILHKVQSVIQTQKTEMDVADFLSVFKKHLHHAIIWRSSIPGANELLLSDEVKFLAYGLYKRGSVMSQLLQDAWVLYELGEKRGGYFVEFGATDGKGLSNTFALEKDYGWSGILAEPNPVWHERLRGNRNCTIETRCVFKTTGDTLEFLATEEPELGGLKATAFADGHANARQKAESIKVTTVTLVDMLKAHNAPQHIDYMSIDTEGSEWDIIQGFDFTAWDITCLTVEHNYAPQRDLIRQHLEKFGYTRKFTEFSLWDDWYIKKG